MSPYEVIDLTLEEFRRFFVDDLEDVEHRKGLFDNYLSFLDVLKHTLKTPYYQWITGSFITAKKQPGDIDLVTFVDYELFIKNLS